MLKKVNVSQLISQLWTSQFQLSSPGFKYLGVAITWPIRSLRKQNSVALASKFTLNLQRWSCLPLSLAGRVQIVKMNVLPRYLYLFQCLPIFLPRLFFKSIDSVVSQFIWAGKNPRICKAAMQRSRSSVGLGLPNFLSYYWPANAHKLLLWFTSPQSSWCQLESDSCISSSPQALACGTLPLPYSQYSQAIFWLASSDFFRYFQLCDFARTHSPAFPLIPTTTGMDHVLLANTTTKGHVSYLYDLLLPTN